jgi:hypothetical protein
MSAAIDRAQVRRAIEDAGESWLLNFWGPDSDRNLEAVGQQIREFQEQYAKRFGERPDPFALFQSQPFKAKAFFQNDTFMVSAEMKVMIWRILLGCEIAEVEFKYTLDQAPSLRITLQTPDGQRETYSGKSVWDFKVLRHFGASSRDDRLILQGYYATRRA